MPTFQKDISKKGCTRYEFGVCFISTILFLIYFSWVASTSDNIIYILCGLFGIIAIIVSLIGQRFLYNQFISTLTLKVNSESLKLLSNDGCWKCRLVEKSVLHYYIYRFMICCLTLEKNNNQC